MTRPVSETPSHWADRHKGTPRPSSCHTTPCRFRINGAWAAHCRTTFHMPRRIPPIELLVVSCGALVAACVQSSPPQGAPQKGHSLEDCGTDGEQLFDVEQAFLEDKEEPPDRCLAPFQECVRACRQSRCHVQQSERAHPTQETLQVGGGCSHLCSRTSEGYLKRAERYRQGDCGG